MTKNKARDYEQIIILVVTGLGILSLLSYTFWHTGGLLSRFISPGWLGYTCAFGAEAIIVMMSWKLAKRQNKWGWDFLTLALISSLFVSAVANYYEGYATYHGVELSWSEFWRTFDVIQFGVSILATALISGLVFAVTDILSTDVTKASKRFNKSDTGMSQNDTVDIPDTSTPVKLTKRQREIKTLNEELTLPELASRYNVTERTIRRDLDKIAQNGHG